MTSHSPQGYSLSSLSRHPHCLIPISQCLFHLCTSVPCLSIIHVAYLFYSYPQYCSGILYSRTLHSSSFQCDPTSSGYSFSPSTMPLSLLDSLSFHLPNFLPLLELSVLLGYNSFHKVFFLHSFTVTKLSQSFSFHSVHHSTLLSIYTFPYQISHTCLYCSHCSILSLYVALSSSSFLQHTLLTAVHYMSLID